jgi:hypothetical protein
MTTTSISRPEVFTDLAHRKNRHHRRYWQRLNNL